MSQNPVKMNEILAEISKGGDHLTPDDLLAMAPVAQQMHSEFEYIQGQFLPVVVQKFGWDSERATQEIEAG